MSPRAHRATRLTALRVACCVLQENDHRRAGRVPAAARVRQRAQLRSHVSDEQHNAGGRGGRGAGPVAVPHPAAGRVAARRPCTYQAEARESAPVAARLRLRAAAGRGKSRPPPAARRRPTDRPAAHRPTDAHRRAPTCGGSSRCSRTSRRSWRPPRRRPAPTPQAPPRGRRRPS